MRGVVKATDYDRECRTLIHQYSMSIQGIPNFPGLAVFMNVRGSLILLSRRTSTSRTARARSSGSPRGARATRARTSTATW